ncbi:regulatory protein RecX [Stakelama tenebrarum]|uniref:Regulatory protein RecX n=1 Tax=Stakelama tenebrarum TaxID=2711215 RepID=A0A6G6Y4Q4_9SPHN|nr:RecX family transcriptional regulator [Sphingosinithalassobacter tenebrarum]QIG79787.1 regulatory protein RecX [Sphingosinithalassobacter tenebrarum]
MRRHPSQSRPPARPLDQAALERLALRYVERYATTRARLTAYLDRKLRERGWAGEGEADSRALAERMAELGYVDDRAFAEARVSAMGRRGLGARRVTLALRQAGIESDDAEAITPQVEANAGEAALAFARRRRIGPFAQEEADRDQRERQLAAMLRAGHAFELAKKIVAMAPGDDIEAILAPD